MSDTAPRSRTLLASEISAFIVRTTREFTGRGPTRTRTYITDALVTVVMEDVLSKGERSLVVAGFPDEVRHARLAFQRAMEPIWVAGVAEILRRPVIAFLSANHLDPDIAIESFVLEPET